MSIKTVDGLAFEEVRFNIYAFAADLKRYLRKRDAARKDSTRQKWERKITDAQQFLEANKRRMQVFQRSAGGNER